MDWLQGFATRIWRHFMHDSLYRNSIFLMLNTVFLSVFGFIFWGVSSRLYPQYEVGISATLITASSLTMTLGILGMDTVLVRFLPKNKSPNELINATFTISALGALFFGTLYLVAAKLFIQDMQLLLHSAFSFLALLLFMPLCAINNVSNNVFLSKKKAQYILIVDTVFGFSRLLLLFALDGVTDNGPLYAHMLATFLTVVLTYALLMKKFTYKPRLVLKDSYLRANRKYAMTNYFVTVSATLPLFILPSIVTLTMGAEQAAYYYIVSVIVAALNIIPLATSQSFFAEGSNNDESSSVASRMRKSLKHSYFLLVPGLIFFALFGNSILKIFGNEYSQQGYGLMVLMLIALVPKTLNYMLTTNLKIKKDMFFVLFASFMYAVILLAGVGISWAANGDLFSLGYSIIAAELCSLVVFGIRFMFKNKSATPVTNLETGSL